MQLSFSARSSRTPSFFPSMRRRFATSACVAVLASVFAVGAAADAPETPSSDVALRGKLDVRNVLRDGDRVREPILMVGSRVYALEGAADVVEALVSWRRKFVDLDGVDVPDVGEANEARVTIGSLDDCAVQEPVALEGVVTASESDAKKRTTTYAIVRGDRRYVVADSSDIRKLKAFEGKNVVVKAQIADDGSVGAVESVDDVERKLLPGEREPRNQKEAIAGNWKGVLDVKKLPSNPGGSGKGKYPVAVTILDDGEGASGKVFGRYTVERIRLRKFRAKTRALEFDIEYSLPQGGTYSIMLDGAFTADWKTLEGSWSSSFLGSGDFQFEYGADRES